VANQERKGVAVNEQGPADQQPSGIVRRALFPLLGSYVAPRTPTEHKLTEIWRIVLGMDKVGIADKYDDLGGDSLLAADIFTEIEKTFKVDMPISSLIDAQTVEQLARKIDELAPNGSK
jgi:acyl carrier protein